MNVTAHGLKPGQKRELFGAELNNFLFYLGINK